MINIPPQYNPKQNEKKWYEFWEKNNFFAAEVDPNKKPYAIVIPPPNITGVLHMGHALNNTIQDILIRFKRMQGYQSLWMPGTDHAGIATQNVVEKELAKERIKRQDLGREQFLERVWRWQKKYGTTIISQLKKLGSSCDWPRMRFTMDQDYYDAVTDVFIQLANENLIYKANYIINWCPRCETALSDEESAHQDTKGALYYIRYPLKDNPKQFITVATTRPETMFGDTAVAVNPKDRRYKKLIGKSVILPLVNEEIPIIADSAIDPKFGTGLVKVTPAHDPNDFEIAQRHGLYSKVVMNANATMNQNVPVEYQGMDRFEAREAILQDLAERGLIAEVKDHEHSVGHCYRCHTMIEPYLSEQWFVDMPVLGKAAEEVVESGKIKFHPPRWKKVYLNWMSGLRGWCISRQIWWGHRIPAWYCLDCKKAYDASRQGKKVAPNEKIDLAEAGIMVSLENPKFCPKCGGNNIEQDADVLDTWFSSWLWPFATFGWPSLGKREQKELDYFYPTATLVTAQEIIFFWVARMIMAGMHFMKEIPFKDVYIHGTVRDITGTKMSKSLGNVIDPLEIIDQYGCDALRFSIISLVATGQDVFLSKDKFESGRNFANKIWNAARFILMNLDPKKANVDLCIFAKESVCQLKDQWILSRFYQTLGNVTDCLDNFRFNEAAKALYEFFWHQFCDWYIELSKNSIDQQTTQVVLYKVLEKTLRILHPIMPFVTEEIWQNLPHEGKSIMISPWPHMQKQFIDQKIDQQMQMIISSIVAIRNIRSVWKISPAQKIEVKISAHKKSSEDLFNQQAGHIKDLAKLDSIEIALKLKKPKHSAVAVVGDVEIFIPLAGIIDVKKEAQRQQEKIEELENILRSADQKLKNKQFLARAPKDVVAQTKERQTQLKDSLKKLNSNLKGFK